MKFSHETIEKNIGLLIILVILTVSVGGLGEIHEDEIADGRARHGGPPLNDAAQPPALGLGKNGRSCRAKPGSWRVCI